MSSLNIDVRVRTGKIVMRKKIFYLTMSNCLAVLLAGCSTLQYLNEPTRSQAIIVTTSTAERNAAPYETLEKGGLSVSYNLVFEESKHLPGYRLTLVFRNAGVTPRHLEPKISIRDSTGFPLASASYEIFMMQAALLAGTAIPAIAVSTQPTSYYHSGTVTSNVSGNRYSYSGTSMPAPSAAGSFVSGFGGGFAMGTAIAAAKSRKEGHRLLSWADQQWLKVAYDVPPEAFASGGLFFPAETIENLPFKIRVEVDGELFEFITRASH